jgi:hypothetical protein
MNLVFWNKEEVGLREGIKLIDARIRKNEKESHLDYQINLPLVVQFSPHCYSDRQTGHLLEDKTSAA